MLKLIAIFVPLVLVAGVWAAPPTSSNSGNSTTDINKIHIVIELRKNPKNTSVPEEVVVYQEVEDTPEVTTLKPKTSTTPKPTKPSTTTTSVVSASSTAMPSLLEFDSSEEVVRRPFPTYNPKQFPRYRPTISSAHPSGPKLLLMGNRPTVDFLKRHFPKAQAPMGPSHNVVVRNARRTGGIVTTAAESAAAAKKPSFQVVGTYKDGRLSR